MTTIKFCGLTRPEDAAYAAQLGASHAGVVFARSARQVSIETAMEVFAAAGSSINHVGVFRDSSAEEIAAVAAAVPLDVVQLHRRVNDSFIDELRKSFAGDIWPVIGVENSADAANQIDNFPVRCNAIVLDTAVRGKSGGTGKPFDWRDMARMLPPASSRPSIIVAGGLTPENVGRAIAALRPDGVDVSSGVESAPGVKNHNLMQAFAEAVHSASIV